MPRYRKNLAVQRDRKKRARRQEHEDARTIRAYRAQGVNGPVLRINPDEHPDRGKNRK